MEKTVSCMIDNLVIYTEEVRPSAFDLFKEKLSLGELQGLVMPVRLTIGKGRSEYHYRLNIGQGGGSITVGFKHNSARESEEFYRMRIEFNPQKNQHLYKGFWAVYNSLFANHTKTVKQFDLAFDVPVEISQVLVYSLTGREKSYFKNTQYFGSPGNTGRLKVYDKKAELEENQGVKIEDEQKTRIEYTMKFEEAITAQLLSKRELNLNADYKIVVFDGEKVKGELKACILAMQDNTVQMNEFTRTTKTKIKKALENMVQLDLDHAYISARENIVRNITSYFRIA